MKISKERFLILPYFTVDHQYDRDQIGEDQTGILAGQTEEGEMVLMVHKGAVCYLFKVSLTLVLLLSSQMLTNDRLPTFS